MKKLLLHSTLLLSFGISSYAQTADEILDKHIEAIGGSNWQSVKSIKLSGSMNQAGVELQMTQQYVIDKAMRTDISMSGQSGYIIVTNKEGWMYMPFMGITTPTAMPEEAVKEAQSQVDIKSMNLANKSTIAKTELIGKDTIGVTPCYVLKVSDKSGLSKKCFIDQKTYYIVRMDATISMQGESQEVSTSYTNFKKVDVGITIPMTIKSIQGDFNYTSVEVNKPIDDKVFVPNNK